MWDAVTTDEFDAWFEALGDTPEGRAAREELLAAIITLRTFGPRLGRPRVDTLNGSRYANMKELRCRTAAMVIRAAFAFDPLQQAVILVAGDKSGTGSERRFYEALIERADRLYARHLAAIAPRVAAKRAAAEAAEKKGRKGKG